MSSPKRIVVTAIAPEATDPATPSPNKRQITPSADQTSPKRSLIIASRAAAINMANFEQNMISTDHFAAPQVVFPSDSALVVKDFSDPLTQLEEPFTAETQHPWQVKHVFCPTDLRHEKRNLLEGELSEMLKGIFPKTKEVTIGRCNSYICFTVEELPPGPWPLTVGGLPITITDGERGRGPLFPFPFRGSPYISICEHLDATECAFSHTLMRTIGENVIKEMHHRLPGLQIIEIILTCERMMHVVLPDHIDYRALRAQLPGKIARCITGYVHEGDLERPPRHERHAKREKDPHPFENVVDDTMYETIRPGIKISSYMLETEDDNRILSSTSGALVQNVAGDRFMTCASHGVGKVPIVLQHQHNGARRVFGRAIMDIAFTDITIVEFDEGISFSHEPFEDGAGQVPLLTKLVGEDPDDDVKPHVLAFLDSPYTGNMDGSVAAISVKIEPVPPVTSSEARITYVIYDWLYIGQMENATENRQAPPDSTCGAMIRDCDGRVLGFFHYHITSGKFAGFAACVSASELVRAGYRLAVSG